MFILAYSGLHINLQAHRLDNVYTSYEKKARIGRGLVSTVLNESHFSFAWTAPRWEGGHVRSPEFRDNKDDSNLSIDSG